MSEKTKKIIAPIIALVATSVLVLIFWVLLYGTPEHRKILNNIFIGFSVIGLFLAFWEIARVLLK